MTAQTWVKTMRVFAVVAVIHVVTPVSAFFEPRSSFGTRKPTQDLPKPLPVIPTQQPPFLAMTTRQSRALTPRETGRQEQDSTISFSVASKSRDSVPGFSRLLSRLWQPIAMHGLRSQSLLAVNLASFPFWAKLTESLQHRGEASFLTLLFVAILQGGLAVFQYRTNPSGELMIPPGLTQGVEMPQNATIFGSEESFKNMSSSSAAATRLRSGGQSNGTETSALLKFGTANALASTLNGTQSRYARILQRINGFLWILVPWLWNHASWILQRNAHLLHIGSILTLTSLFDFPQSLWLKRQRSKAPPTSNNSTTTAPSLSQGDTEHVLVIGDSLAIGLGSVDQFDSNKTNDWPFQRIENLGNPEDMADQPPGPAFPKALAQILASKLQKPVTWRSAGVDGGDVPNIQKFCLGVIDEEVEKGRVPDVVVILCGANDMKYCLSSPLQREKWPRAFRSKLSKLIQDIRSKAPQTTVVVPAIPTQMFHKNSPLNVFPLGQLLDAMVGFWDSQKKFVVDSFDSDGVQYIGLSPMEINRWYDPQSDILSSDEPDMLQDCNTVRETCTAGITLLALDGVHPNARCYTNWGRAIGQKLLANR